MKIQYSIVRNVTRLNLLHKHHEQSEMTIIYHWQIIEDLDLVAKLTRVVSRPPAPCWTKTGTSYRRPEQCLSNCLSLRHYKIFQNYSNNWTIHCQITQKLRDKGIHNKGEELHMLKGLEDAKLEIEANRRPRRWSRWKCMEEASRWKVTLWSSKILDVFEENPTVRFWAAS